MTRMKDRGGLTPDVMYFERLVAKAILFKRADRIVARQEFGGYKAAITCYSVARLSHSTAQRLDLSAIWGHQDVSAEVEAALKSLSVVAYHVLTELTPGGANVTEWAKRDQCWRLMREQPWDIPAALLPQLVGRSVAASDGRVAEAPDADTDEEVAVIREVVAVGADGWLGLANWAKETGNLAPWQRRLSYGIGVRLKRGSDPTMKQAVQGKKILEEAAGIGYVPT